jgi:hypothetical protein
VIHDEINSIVLCVILVSSLYASTNQKRDHLLEVFVATHNPLQEGEFVIIKDDPKAETWYCAEVMKLLADRFEVHY